MLRLLHRRKLLGAREPSRIAIEDTQTSFPYSRTPLRSSTISPSNRVLVLAVGSTNQYIYGYIKHTCCILPFAPPSMMPTRNSGTQVSNSTIRTRISRLLLSAITCAALLSATGSAEAGRARFQLRLSPKHRESQCLRLHEESKPVGGDLPVHIRGTLSNSEVLWLLSILYELCQLQCSDK